MILLSLGCSRETGAHEKGSAPSGQRPDNTRINERDRNDGTLTPLDQSNDQRDLDITASIRKALVGDDALSSNAKNVKVITRSGIVTLRGPVKDGAEKSVVAAKAGSVPGVVSVVNELDVAGR